LIRWQAAVQTGALLTVFVALIADRAGQLLQGSEALKHGSGVRSFAGHGLGTMI